MNDGRRKVTRGEALRKISKTSRVPRSSLESFSRISFKESPLGAERNFRNRWDLKSNQCRVGLFLAKMTEFSSYSDVNQNPRTIDNNRVPGGYRVDQT